MLNFKRIRNDWTTDELDVLWSGVWYSIFDSVTGSEMSLGDFIKLKSRLPVFWSI